MSMTFAPAQTASPSLSVSDVASAARGESRALPRSMPAVLLRLEAVIVAVLAIAAYARLGGSLGLFLGLFLVPDLAMLGYLAGPGVGARLYNAVHTYLGPAALGLASYALDSATGMQFALIWTAHCGIDRTFGYGLKYTTRFRDTHLGRV
ncbi:MAG TPA: DUF4260 domain-containing protein [Haliangium sp.]|nr:DUF4260 domain-containing protein [Haliangium sp.]